MTFCSVNVAEMRALVNGLVAAQVRVPNDASRLETLMGELMLDTGAIERTSSVTHWIADEVVEQRRRLAMAEALAAASPEHINYVQFDDSFLSTKTPAQAAADAKQAVALMRAGKTDALIAMLSTEGYDPYFAKAFAQDATPRDLEDYICTNFGAGQLRGDVDPKQYETVLTGLAQTLGLATRGTGDLSLGPGWTDNFLQFATAPRIAEKDANSTEAWQQNKIDQAQRSALMLLLARGDWSTPFLQEATRRAVAFEKFGREYWDNGLQGPGAVTPAGKPFPDFTVALMAALAHNPEAARWAFTQGGTTDMPLGGNTIPVNGFLHYVLLDHDYINDGDRSVALLALQAGIGGDKYSPIAMDVQTISNSLAEQKKHWDDMPWYEKWGHSILDAIGMIPLIGDIANIPNAAWYSLEGDWANAGITAAGSIPFLGDAALGARLVGDGGKVARTLKAIRLVDLSGKDLTEGIDSAELLRKASQVEPGVFHFGSLDDFAAAANVPHPNVIYEFQGVRYTTDEFGRTVEIAGEPLKSRGIADAKLRADVGKGPGSVSGDVGFHLWAESFGGHTTKLNLVPGNGKVDAANFAAFKNLNTSEYAKMENQVRAALKDPAVKDLNLTVEPVYAGSAARPTSFYVTIERNGVPEYFQFMNAPVRR